MSKLKYVNSPIMEAICEIKFSKDNIWDWTIPGILYTNIKEGFPEKKEVRGMGLEFGVGKNTDPVVSKYSDSVDRVQFWSENREAVVQIGENRLIINKRRPYDGWENYSKQIFEIIQQYNKVSESSPVESINIRYINRIDKLPNPLDLEEYFLIYPKFPSNLSVAVATGPLSVQGNFNLDENEDISNPSSLSLRFFNQPIVEKKELSWVIDINYKIQFIEAKKTLLDIEKEIEEGHDKIIETFESCITDKLRDFFIEEE